MANNRRIARRENSSLQNTKKVSYDYKCDVIRELARNNLILGKNLDFFGTRYTNKLFACIPPPDITGSHLEDVLSNALQITVNTCSPFRAPRTAVGHFKWRLISLEEGVLSNLVLHQPDFWNDNSVHFKEASKEIPDFRAWTSSKYNHPIQKNSKYY